MAEAVIIRAGFSGDTILLVKPGPAHSGPSSPESLATMTLTFKTGSTSVPLQAYDKNGDNVSFQIDINNTNDKDSEDPIEPLPVKLTSTDCGNNKRRLTASNGTYVDLTYGVQYMVHITSDDAELDIQDFMVTNNFVLIKETGTDGSKTSAISLNANQVAVYDGDNNTSSAAAINLSSYADGDYAQIFASFTKLGLKAIETTSGKNTETATFNAKTEGNVYAVSLNSNEAAQGNGGINHDDSFKLSGYIKWNVSKVWHSTSADSAFYNFSDLSAEYQAALAFDMRTVVAGGSTPFSYTGGALKPRNLISAADDDLIVSLTALPSNVSGAKHTLTVKAANPADIEAMPADERSNIRTILYVAGSEADIAAQLASDFAAIAYSYADDPEVHRSTGGVVNSWAAPDDLADLGTGADSDSTIIRMVKSKPADSANVAFDIISSRLADMGDSAKAKIVSVTLADRVDDNGNTVEGLFLARSDDNLFATSGAHGNNDRMKSVGVTDTITLFTFSTAGIQAAWDEIDGQVKAEQAYTDGNKQRFQWRYLEDGVALAAFATKVSDSNLRFGSADEDNKRTNSRFLVSGSPNSVKDSSNANLPTEQTAEELSEGVSLHDTTDAGIIKRVNSKYSVSAITISAVVTVPAALGQYQGENIGEAEIGNQEGNLALTKEFVGAGHDIYGRPSDVTTVWSAVGHDGKAVVVFKIGENATSYWPSGDSIATLKLDQEEGENLPPLNLVSGKAGVGLTDMPDLVPSNLKTGPFKEFYDTVTSDLSTDKYLVYTGTLAANTPYSKFGPYLELTGLVETATNAPADQFRGTSSTVRSGEMNSESAEWNRTLVRYNKALNPATNSVITTKAARASYSNGNGIVLQATHDNDVGHDGAGFVLQAEDTTTGYERTEDDEDLTTASKQTFDAVEWTEPAEAGAITEESSRQDINGVKEGRFGIRNLLFQNGAALAAPGDDVESKGLYYVVQYTDSFEVANDIREDFNADNVLEAEAQDGVTIVGNSVTPANDDAIEVKLRATLPSSTIAGTASSQQPSIEEKILIWAWATDAANGAEVTIADMLDGAPLADKIKAYIGDETVTIGGTEYKGWQEYETNATISATTLLRAPHGKDYRVSALKYSSNPAQGVYTPFYSPPMGEDDAETTSVDNRHVVSIKLNALVEANEATDVKKVSEALQSSLLPVRSVGQLSGAEAFFIYDGQGRQGTGINVTTAGRPISSLFFIFDREDSHYSSADNVNEPANRGNTMHSHDGEQAPVLKVHHLPLSRIDASKDYDYVTSDSNSFVGMVSGGLKPLVDYIAVSNYSDGDASFVVFWKSDMGKINGVAGVTVSQQGEFALAMKTQ